MGRKALNIIIGIVLSFIVIFFAGSFAYERYIIQKSDSNYEDSLQGDLDEASKDNQSGQTSEESKN
ncbi:MAG: hypothetical protein ACI4PF_06775 [Christensenellales bacterium]